MMLKNSLLQGEASHPVRPIHPAAPGVAGECTGPPPHTVVADWLVVTQISQMSAHGTKEVSCQPQHTSSASLNLQDPRPPSLKGPHTPVLRVLYMHRREELLRGKNSRIQLLVGECPALLIQRTSLLILHPCETDTNLI